MTANDVVALVYDDLLPVWQRERRKLDVIDHWARWEHDKPHRPYQATTEYRQLVDRAQAPWGDLIVGSVAQTLYVEGYKRPDAPDDAPNTGWEIWQANRMDRQQVALHRAALSYGLAYGVALPGTTLTGAPMPSLRGVSPRDMVALYDDPAADEWPVVALQVSRVGKGVFRIIVLDAVSSYEFRVPDLAAKPQPGAVSIAAHDVGVCPVVRYRNRADLEGRIAGEIEPFIPLLGRIDQTTFDRLVVQRFAAWIVRTIAGMNLETVATTTGESPLQAKMRLAVEDFLVAADKDTRFGSLPATPLDGFIKAHDSDLADLAAVSQTPAFELMGQMVNMSAEALAAAKASQTAKSDERKHEFGEDHEQFIRLGCHIAGDEAAASDFQAQVRWADTSIRSLAQAADALGKLTQMLGVPPEVLWPKIPGFTQQDVAEAKAKAAEGGATDQLLAALTAGQTSQPAAPPALPAA